MPPTFSRCHGLVSIRNFLYAVILLLNGLYLPAGRAATFDYFVFSLSWSPEYCHEHPKDRSTECNAQAKMAFVVHGLWPSNSDRSNPTGCLTAPFNRSSVPGPLSQIMPSQIFAHEWQTHGVCSGMTESVYFQKIISLFNSLAIPIRNTGQDQKMTPASIRQAFSQSNAGTKAESFAVQDDGQYLTEVRSCWDRAFSSISCPARGDTRNAPITIRARP